MRTIETIWTCLCNNLIIRKRGVTRCCKRSVRGTTPHKNKSIALRGPNCRSLGKRRPTFLTQSLSHPWSRKMWWMTTGVRARTFLAARRRVSRFINSTTTAPAKTSPNPLSAPPCSRLLRQGSETMAVQLWSARLAGSFNNQVLRHCSACRIWGTQLRLGIILVGRAPRLLLWPVVPEDFRCHQTMSRKSPEDIRTL